MRYLALCDFDGTLSDDSGKISASTNGMIRQFTQKHKLCILSYSDFFRLEEIWRQGGQSFDFFSFHSSMGYIQGELIFGKLDTERINALLLQLGQWLYTAYATDKDAVYIFRFRSRLELIYPKGKRIEVSTLKQEVSSLTLAIDTGGLFSFYRFAEENDLTYTVLATDSHRQIIKISPKGYTKEDMLYRLKTLYPGYTTVGIGDSDTDYEYIRHCDIKIAMRNASASLIDKCDYTTKEDNLHDGCIKELLKLK